MTPRIWISRPCPRAHQPSEVSDASQHCSSPVTLPSLGPMGPFCLKCHHPPCLRGQPMRGVLPPSGGIFRAVPPRPEKVLHSTLLQPPTTMPWVPTITHRTEDILFVAMAPTRSWATGGQGSWACSSLMKEKSPIKAQWLDRCQGHQKNTCSSLHKAHADHRAPFLL